MENDDEEQMNEQMDELQKEYDYSHPIVTIDFFLDPNQSETGIRYIIARITNQYTKDSQSIELVDDSNGSFVQLTSLLTPFLTQFQKIIPHTSKSLVQINKESKEERFMDIQESFIQRELDADLIHTIEENTDKTTCPPFNWNPKVAQDMKDRLNKLMDKNKLKKSELDQKIQNAIADMFAYQSQNLNDKMDDKTTTKQAYITGLLDCAQYLGRHSINNRNRDIFLTKEGVITDGYFIYAFNITIVKEEGDTVKITDIAEVTSWKLVNKPQDYTLMATEPEIFNKSNTEFELAVNLMAKYGTYETGNRDKTAAQKGTCTEPFKIETLKDSEYKSLLQELINKNSGDTTEVKNIQTTIDAIVTKYENTPEIKAYNKEILGPECTLFLGKHTIDGVSDRPVFLSKDGIITDGYVIISLNQKGLKKDEVTQNTMIIDPGSGLTGGYIRSFKIANKNKSPLSILSNETEYDVVVRELKEKGTYDSLVGEPGAGFFGGKMMSKHKKHLRKTRKTNRL
jgi:hypothetical protein